MESLGAGQPFERNVIPTPVSWKICLKSQRLNLDPTVVLILHNRRSRLAGALRLTSFSLANTRGQALTLTASVKFSGVWKRPSPSRHRPGSVRD